MNRRTAMISSLFLGGLAARRSLAQDGHPRRLADADRNANSSRSLRDGARSSSSFSDAEDERARPSFDADGGDLPDGLPREAGLQLKKWDIARYTRIPDHQAPPERAIIDWIFLRTGVAAWHGTRPAALWANRSQLSAYNSPEILKQVGDIVERFTDAVEDTLSVNVHLVAAVDTRWRYTVYSQMAYVGGGPQGQQIWTLPRKQTGLVLAQMQVQQGFQTLAQGRLDMVNGQTVRWRTHEERAFVGGLRRDSSAGLTFQPRPDRVDEGIILKLSPLLTFEGNAVDAKIDLKVNTLRTLHRTKVIAPADAGSHETTIDVPEASQTHLEQTVKNWPLSQTLVISCGIHPGILAKKSGLFNLPIPGTYPTATEVLVFLDVDKAEHNRAPRSRGRSNDADRGRSGDANRERSSDRPRGRSSNEFEISADPDDRD